MDDTFQITDTPSDSRGDWFKQHWYTIVVALILLLTLVSRFYNLGDRVMAHDEVNHVVPSYDFFSGNSLYIHSPVTHGPLQFHLIALSYFLFGDNDFTSRLPHAIFSVATVIAVLFLFRRYMGKYGALIAGGLFLLSPSLLYYGRYARNEAFVALFTVVAFYAVLRYLEKGEHSSLIILTAVTALHFATKETAFIFAAQMLLFLAIYFMGELVSKPWPEEKSRTMFIGLGMGAISLLLGAVVFAAIDVIKNKAVTEGSTAVPAEGAAAAAQSFLGLEIVLVLLALLLGIAAIYVLIRSFSITSLKNSRTFDLLIVLGTFVLPQLTAFPIKMIGWDPLNYAVDGLLRTGIVLVVMFAISLAIGLWWNRNTWILCAITFYGIFIVLYTAFFTNGLGFFTGIVGSLGYWLSQQSVNRGEQPWYYFLLVLVPVYEYAAALGTLMAVYLGIRYRKLVNKPLEDPEPLALPEPEPAYEASLESEPYNEELTGEGTARLPVLLLFIYWSITALIAYSLAGEKMPWLVVHIAIGLLLSAGWAFGFILEKVNWSVLASRKGLLGLLVLPVAFASLFGVLSGMLGAIPPFQGNTLDQLRSTVSFVSSSLFLGLSVAGIFYLMKDWLLKDMLKYALVLFIALMVLLNARTSYRANYVLQDTAMEYLVYAHAANGPKEILKQVEEISKRTTNGLNLKVAYDNDALYPYWWYLRHYPNKFWFGEKINRSLRDYPVLIVSDGNYGKIAPVIRDEYISYEYTRLWWPNQDYWNLTNERFRNAITSPEQRAAIFQIWLNRDFSYYAKINNKSDLTLETWSPSTRFKIFIRKDIINNIWNYGVVPVPPAPDPYAANTLTLAADKMIGSKGSGDGQFNDPKGIALAPDGRIYVSDTRNHRIQRFSADGVFELAWGVFGDVATGSGNPGTFNEPWGLAVGPDGSVYVADTWNHRIQKFNADGEFLQMWGYFSQDGTPNAFYGPRSVAVDSQNRVYVSDTGNKRIVIFDAQGAFLGQFGTPGMEAGQFDEQVGVTVSNEGLVYVVDTWNQRVQAFKEGTVPNTFAPYMQWEVEAWFGSSIENKPYITVDPAGNVFISDPEASRVIEFNRDGAYLRNWGDVGNADTSLGLPVGLAADTHGGIWVVDSLNSRIMHFVMPAD